MFRILTWLLNSAYLTLVFMASPWIIWSAVRHGKYREGFAQRLLGRAPQRKGDRSCVWLHAVSVGEVNLLATTVDALTQRRPDCELVISTTTRAGYQLACRKYSTYHVFYCPLDFSWAVKTALRRVRPNLLVLAELELWPNLIMTAQQHNVRVAVINGRLSDPSYRGYRRFRPLVASLLRRVDLVVAQNEEMAMRFRCLGAQRVAMVGSLKFDGAVTNRENRQTQALRQLAGIRNDEVVFLAGSTQAPEEEYAIEIFQRLSTDFPQLRLVLVPRHPERFEEVAQMLERWKLPSVRRSQMQSVVAAGESTVDSAGQFASAILVDTIGELGDWWGLASIGLVGGSFGSRGGQNMLEPAAFGVTTCFGPNTRNFRDIVAQLLASRGAEVVNDRDELERFVRRALRDPAWAQQLGQRGRELVLSQQGATERTVALLSPLVDGRLAPLGQASTTAA